MSLDILKCKENLLTMTVTMSVYAATSCPKQVVPYASEEGSFDNAKTVSMELKSLTISRFDFDRDSNP